MVENMRLSADIYKKIDNFCLGELKLLNVHLNNIAHQMSAIYVELRRIDEDGILLRRREKPTDALPFLTKSEQKTDDKEKSAFE